MSISYSAMCSERNKITFSIAEQVISCIYGLCNDVNAIRDSGRLGWPDWQTIEYLCSVIEASYHRFTITLFLRSASLLCPLSNGSFRLGSPSG